jgi:hypothetical protein
MSTGFQNSGRKFESGNDWGTIVPRINIENVG